MVNTLFVSSLTQLEVMPLVAKWKLIMQLEVANIVFSAFFSLVNKYINSQLLLKQMYLDIET